MRLRNNLRIESDEFCLTIITKNGRKLCIPKDLANELFEYEKIEDKK